MTRKEVQKKMKERLTRMLEREDVDDDDLMLSSRVQQEYYDEIQRLNQDGTYNEGDDDDDDDDEVDLRNVQDVEWIQEQRKMNRRIDKIIGEDGRRQMAARRDERIERRNLQTRIRRTFNRSLAEEALNLLEKKVRKREREDCEESDEDEYSEDEKKDKKKERRGRPKKKPKVQEKKKKKKKKKKKRMLSSADEEDDEEDTDEDESEDEEDDEEDTDEDESEDEDDEDHDDPWVEKASNKAQLERLSQGCFIWVQQRYDQVLKHPSVLWIAKMVKWGKTKIRVRWYTSDNPERGRAKKPGRPKQAAAANQLTWGPWRETKQENMIEAKIVRLVIELNRSGTIKANSRELIQNWMNDLVLPWWLDDYQNEYERKMKKTKDDKQLKQLKNELEKKKKQLSDTVRTAMDS